MMLMIGGRCGSAVEQDALFERKRLTARPQMTGAIRRTRKVGHFRLACPC
ncbi:hypothetical protein BRPE64_CCDS05880 [Caballeronia insecticola]|uniref:Uncharacterized protein n=1 Tax=Caballeronia insecticola TaxID=758793 RepID=R4X2E0_9BURK|nr:hypothetical protein BRPE64_CCDS05880 [Caballeronia insecticola]